MEKRSGVAHTACPLEALVLCYHSNADIHNWVCESVLDIYIQALFHYLTGNCVSLQSTGSDQNKTLLYHELSCYRHRIWFSFSCRSQVPAPAPHIAVFVERDDCGIFNGVALRCPRM